MPNGLMFHILDDFLILAPIFDMCKSYLEEFLTICDKIGIPMAPEKTMGSSTCLTFLGIELNTVQKVARLPNDKVDRCLSLLSEFLQRKKGHFKRVATLCGTLNFACQVVVPGRAFLRRMFDLCKGLRKPHHRIKLSRAVKEDLKVWKEFLVNFNGKCFFLEDRFISADLLQLYTDASGSMGYGAVFQQSWFYGEWDENWEDINITVKYLYPIVLALELWGNKLQNKSVMPNCDNEALVFVLNKQSSKDPQIMYLVRRLVLLFLSFNIKFKSTHLPGRCNVLSDPLSRLQVYKFRSMLPEADILPTGVPPLPKLPG